MSKPIRHHIVPQCYLESFTNSNGKLFVFPKDGARNTFEASTNNVAVRKHYYSFENENGEIDVRIEKVLGDLEGIAKPILRSIQARKLITDQQKEDLSVFIGILFSRNPNYRDGVEETLRQTIERAKSMIIAKSKDIDELIHFAPKDIITIAGGRDKVRDWLNENMEVVMSPGHVRQGGVNSVGHEGGNPHAARGGISSKLFALSSGVDSAMASTCM